MFSHCENLVGGEGAACDGEHNIGAKGDDAEYARIDRPGINAPGYFTGITRDRETITELARSTVGKNGLADGGIYRIVGCASEENYNIKISDEPAEFGSSCYKLQAAKDVDFRWRAIFIKDGNGQDTGFVAFEAVSVVIDNKYMNFYGADPKAQTPICTYTKYYGDYGSQWIILPNGTTKNGEAPYHILSALDCNLAIDGNIADNNGLCIAFYSDVSTPDYINWRFERVE